MASHKMSFLLHTMRRIVIIPIILISIIGSYIYLNKSSETYSLYGTLNLYGYTKDSQKQALEYLLRQSKVIEPDQSFQDIFPPRNNKNDLFKDILKFVKLIQQNFVVRKGAQERWEISGPSWMQENTAALLEALAELQLTQEVLPPMATPDAICILGSTYTSMDNRIEFASKLFQQKMLNAKYLILLAGERKVTVGVDGTEDDLLKIAQKYNKESLDSLTETDLIKELYEKSPLVGKFETVVIDTPAGNLPRPTTETTVFELSQWLETHPDAKSIVFVSNQPYVGYQKAIITAVFKSRKFDIQFSVSGSGVKDNASPHKLIEALGSEIWARTPLVISTMNGVPGNSPIVNEFKELYEKTPLIYSIMDFRTF